ncbi:MAG: MCP four helix bundle domain-containing protein [Saprospiraceae bacterium]|nr:MCP four helix bundle domain-containing protein [Saprospiraceae bacterium]
MDWIFSIRAKLKAAFFLALICIVVLVNIYWERSNIADINSSFCSIYDDRLLPATYVFHLTNHLYQKRLILEHQLHHHDTLAIAEAKRRIAIHNAAMDTLIEDFESTYLVESEGRLLVDFKQELKDYNLLEKKLLESSQLRLPPDEDPAGLIPLFEANLEELTLLSQVQIDVGRAMRDDSMRMLANTKVLTMLEAALIVIIALVIQALVFASRSVAPPRPQRHDLN